MIIFVTIMLNLFYSILSGLLLSFSWPESGFFPLIFIAFIPLLNLEESLSSVIKKKFSASLFLYVLLSFFIFNIITTYWIYHATLFGAIMAFLINSLLMTCAFYLFHVIKFYLGKRLGLLSFILIWVSMEYIHLNWDLSWPWLTLGNVFANFPSLIQWYEYTGVLGGSFWVLSVNVLLFRLIKYKREKLNFFSLIFMFFTPVLISLYMYYNFNDTQYNKINVVIGQPNIDPYEDKFVIDPKKQIDDFIEYASSEIKQETQLLLGPETMLQESIWENKIESSYSIQALRSLQNKLPNLNILIGASSYNIVSKNKNNKYSVREFLNSKDLYEAYNSAIFLPDSGDIEIYHKTELVPGVETTPFPWLFNKVSAFSVDLGGISGSLGDYNKLNTFKNKELNILPLICYESIYGELASSKFFNLICIITNDGWWKNTAGYKQHLAYARIRAIENRRAVVRSANTGISSSINMRGDIIEKTKWDTVDFINVDVSLNDRSTFYNRFGDYIGRICVFFSVILCLITFVKRKIKPAK